MQDAIALVRNAQDELFEVLMTETRSNRVELNTFKGINILNRVLMHLDERSEENASTI